MTTCGIGSFNIDRRKAMTKTLSILCNIYEKQNPRHTPTHSTNQKVKKRGLTPAKFPKCLGWTPVHRVHQQRATVRQRQLGASSSWSSGGASANVCVSRPSWLGLHPGCYFQGLKASLQQDKTQADTFMVAPKGERMGDCGWGGRKSVWTSSFSEAIRKM